MPEPLDKSSRSETTNKVEQSLERMEALLKQSAQGIHILFDNQQIARALCEATDEKDFFDLAKMRMVQEVMTLLVAKKTYYDKVSYLRDLDSTTLQLLIRTYFHIVENTVRQNSIRPH